MRALFFFLLLVTGSSAQTSISKILELGLKNAARGFAPVPASEQQEVLVATAALLAKHVTFRPDETASSIYTGKENWHIEWRKLAVVRINSMAISEADRLNGITRRYQANLQCEASRDWPPKATAWSGWRAEGFGMFPSVIVVEEIKGALVARGITTRLPKFQPGPGPSVLDKPAGKGQPPSLPPGMTRGS